MLDIEEVVLTLRDATMLEDRGRAWIVEKNGRWYACFECERAAQPLPFTGKIVGVDRGIHVLAATSEGELIRNGRAADKHRRVVTGHARALDAATVKDAKGRPTNWKEPKRIAAVQRLARAKERAANARLDGLHKIAAVSTTEPNRICEGRRPALSERRLRRVNGGAARIRRD